MTRVSTADDRCQAVPSGMSEQSIVWLTTVIAVTRLSLHFYKKWSMEAILVLTDFTKRAERAALYAMQLAAVLGCRLILYHSFYDFPPATLHGLTEAEAKDAETMKKMLAELDLLAQTLRDQYAEHTLESPPAVSTAASDGLLRDTIATITALSEVSFVVMGGRNEPDAVDRFLFGSSARDAIERSEKPVLIIPSHCVYKTITRISFASELRPADHSVIRFLKEFAQKAGVAEICVLHVAGEHPKAAEKLKHYELFTKLVAGPGFQNFRYVSLNGDDVAAALVSYVRKEGVDVLATVHKKRSLIGRLFHESISVELVDRNQAPHLVFVH